MKLTAVKSTGHCCLAAAAPPQISEPMLRRRVYLQEKVSVIALIMCPANSDYAFRPLATTNNLLTVILKPEGKMSLNILIAKKNSDVQKRVTIKHLTVFHQMAHNLKNHWEKEPAEIRILLVTTESSILLSKCVTMVSVLSCTTTKRPLPCFWEQVMSHTALAVDTDLQTQKFLKCCLNFPKPSLLYCDLSDTYSTIQLVSTKSFCVSRPGGH